MKIKQAQELASKYMYAAGITTEFTLTQLTSYFQIKFPEGKFEKISNLYPFIKTIDKK